MSAYPAPSFWSPNPRRGVPRTTAQPGSATPGPAESSVALDQTCRPVSASSRDLTIPGVVPVRRSFRDQLLALVHRR